MSKSSKSKEIKESFANIFVYLHNNIKTINNSKLFAGLIVITLNIASRFVTIKLSRTMESYLKFTLSRDVLVFCIVWMGSREIYVALVLTLLFTFIMDFLLNEESIYCILPEKFTTYHTELLDSAPTEGEITNAKALLERVGKI
jgi:hypothetical protein